MPYIYLRLAFGESIPKFKKKINPLPNDLAWVRGMDTEPVLTSLKAIKALEDRLDRRLEKFKR